jgi:Putative prokaryotic signal transducing protein
VPSDDPAELIRLYSTASIMDGYIVKGRLEAEGIPVLLKGDAEGPYRMGPVHLYVARADEPRARELFDSVAVADADDDETAAVDSLNGDQPAD